MALEDSTIADGSTPAKCAAKYGYEKLREVQVIFATLSVELQGDRFWRYQRQVSPGLQEYIEALSFANFLDHGSLITFDQVQATLSDPKGNPVRHMCHMIHLSIYLDLQYITVFSITGFRLFSRSIGSHWGAYALRYIWHLTERW